MGFLPWKYVQLCMAENEEANGMWSRMSLPGSGNTFALGGVGGTRPAIQRGDYLLSRLFLFLRRSR